MDSSKLRLSTPTTTVCYDWIGSSLGLAIGSRRSGKPPGCWNHFDAVLNVTDTEYEGIHDSIIVDHGDGKSPKNFYLQLPVKEGKRDRYELERWMTVGIVFCIFHLQLKRRVLIHCAQGKDRSVCIALATVVLFCKLTYPLQWKGKRLSDFPIESILCPKGNSETGETMYRSSGFSVQTVESLLGNSGREKLFQLVRAHEEQLCVAGQDHNSDEANLAAGSAENEGRRVSPLADKETIRIALHLIRQDREVAEPARSSMQKLNRFFMSEDLPRGVDEKPKR